MNAECKTCDKRGGYFCTEDCDHWGDEPRSSDTLDSVVVPGARIEIFARGIREADNRWEQWTVVDWETPRRAKDGRWLFTAQRDEPSLGPCPMMVEPERIRRPLQPYQRAYAAHVESGEPLVAPGLQMALKGFDIRGPLQRGFA